MDWFGLGLAEWVVCGLTNFAKREERRGEEWVCRLLEGLMEG